MASWLRWSISWQRPATLLFAWFTGMISWLLSSPRGKDLIDQDIESSQNGDIRAGTTVGAGTSSDVYLIDKPPDLEIEIISYCPPGVTDIVASSFNCFLGQIDENTLLKYLHDENPDIKDQARLHTEAQIYTILGDHDRIIKFKGGDGHGIRLEYAINGSVAGYLRQANVSPTTSQRIKWAQQAAEGMAYIHKLGVLHCDTNANNLLLDKNLNIKFADFQGRYLSPDGTIILDGLSSENVKSFMPRSDPNYADQKTDIFALGSTIYYMMTGHEPFPELNSFDDDDEAEIVARYKSGQFPVLDPQLGGDIVHNCWVGAYGSASEVADGFQMLIKGTLDV